MNITKRLITLMLIGALVSSPVFASSFLSPVTDTVNSGIINTKMLADDSVSHLNIDATVNHGVAIFIGTVHSKAQLDELIRIGHSVSGIRGVDVSRVHISTR